MYVTSGIETEIQLTLDGAVTIANALLNLTAPQSLDSDVDMRSMLSDLGFSRAALAPEAAIRRTTARFSDLVPRMNSLPEQSVEHAVAWINAELTEISIMPSVTDHDGSGLHIHWTPSSATFDDQVLADVLMALTQELCDHGTRRFGRCAAVDCNRLFFDTTRNGSRRFCSDPRCASRTHTADHRRRKRA